MMKKYTEEERMAEEIMAAFGKELGKARSDFFEALMDPDREDPPMFVEGVPEADEGFWDEEEPLDFATWKARQEGLEQTEKKTRGRKRMLRRVLILAATLVLVMGLVAVAEGVKLKESTLYMKEDTGESTRIVDISKAEFDVEDFRVTYVPEGYELVEDVVMNEFVRKIRYCDKDNDGVEICISKTKKFGANVDNESAERTEVLVNDKQAYLFDDASTKMIVWQLGDCTIDVMGRISEEELTAIAKNIFVN